MAKHNWSEITKEDVVKAIELFDAENSEYPEPRTTFLLYGNKKYPAKHIRGMAYKVHYGIEISKEDFTGGQETVRFFERLGFDMQYVHKSMNTSSNKVKNPQDRDADIEKVSHSCEKETDDPENGIKIGLYLQTDNVCNQRSFDEAIEQVRESDIDILVLPEIAYVPFYQDMRSADFLSDNPQGLYEKGLILSRDIGRSVVFCHEDRYGTYMSIYANAYAKGEETLHKAYIKHTMAERSACEIGNYPEYSRETFEPILYKGYRIGLTICYDCNHAIFSRKYGLNGVDIIINSTGGDVIYDKWNKYNKARAIENHCFTFVTMGGPNKKNAHNYVFGSTPEGRELHPKLLDGSVPEERNLSGAIYVYDTSEYDGSTEIDSSIDQAETVNKQQDLCIKEDAIKAFISKGTDYAPNIKVIPHKADNIVLCMVNGEDIMRPETVLSLLYDKSLKKIKNKRYIIVNRWDELDKDFYETKLTLILKVRSMENYCAVILDSPQIKKCYQCGKNRTAQVVKPVNGSFGIDLSRTSGPEAIWKNKLGMKACWRENIEYLIESMKK